MRLLVILCVLFLLCSGGSFPNFTKTPLSYTRVREAYAAKEKLVDKTLAAHSISTDSLRIYLRVFKTEKTIELWAKNHCDLAFSFIKEFPICDLSGDVGPKRRYRDLQVPEGFYHISDLNPYSKYYLSMEVNYPNASDSIRGVRGRLGNEIFIHGSCISSGCLAITDDKIKELFVYCVEASQSGQSQIDLTIYPTRLNELQYAKLTSEYRNNKDYISLWKDLKKSYDLFEQTKIPPKVKFLPDGTHHIEEFVQMKPQPTFDSLMKNSKPLIGKPTFVSLQKDVKCDSLIESFF